MAKLSITLPEDLQIKLSKLGDKTDEICEKVLEAGGEVVLKQVKSNLHASLSGKSTGQLESSLGISPVRLNRDGNFDVKIGFSENRNDGKSNAMLASVLEYGKHNQPPQPFMKPAQTQSKRAAIAAMENALNEEINKL